MNKDLNNEQLYFVKMVEGLFDQIDSMPESARDAVIKMGCNKILDETGEQDKVIAFMKAYEQHKDIKNLNLQIVNIIGSMKAMLSGFDEDDNGTANAMNNIKFFCRFMQMFSLPMQNLAGNMDEFKKKYE